LRIRWAEEEGEYLEYINGVNFSTKYNTPMDRLDRLEKSEDLFKKIGIPYSIYNRGLYLELKEELEAKKIKESLDTTPPIIVEETIIEEPIILIKESIKSTKTFV
jgi:hypothetical protein